MTRSLVKFIVLIPLVGLTALIASPEKASFGTAKTGDQIHSATSDVTVLFFILHDCPICNRYVPEMNRIARDYQKHGFGFTAVYSDIDFSSEEAQKHAQEYHVDFPFVVDTDHRLAARFGIKVVPTVAVFNRNGELLYRGRIDDLYADVDKQRPAATHHDLREALENIAAGIKPARAWAPAVGCPIGYDQPGS